MFFRIKFCVFVFSWMESNRPLYSVCTLASGGRRPVGGASEHHENTLFLVSNMFFPSCFFF